MLNSFKCELIKVKLVVITLWTFLVLAAIQARSIMSRFVAATGIIIRKINNHVQCDYKSLWFRQLISVEK